MANIDNLFNQDALNKVIEEESMLPTAPQRPLTPEEQRKLQAEEQVCQLFQKPQRTIIPSATELQNLINLYFVEILPENYSKYTLHCYLGFTEENINIHILPDDDLKEIYNFALEKIKAKAELTMQIAGRSTDAFAMQNLAGWRKKDPEEQEQVSGLAELHKSINEYKKNNNK